MLARGGDAGGGGGRISVVVPVGGYYSFFGSYDTSGGQLSGIRAASGKNRTVQFILDKTRKNPGYDGTDQQSDLP